MNIYENDFAPRRRFCNPGIFPNSVGIDPVNSFVPMSRACRLLKRPNSDGIGPVSELLPV